MLVGWEIVIRYNQSDDIIRYNNYCNTYNFLYILDGPIHNSIFHFIICFSISFLFFQITLEVAFHGWALISSHSDACFFRDSKPVLIFKNSVKTTLKWNEDHSNGSKTLKIGLYILEWRTFTHNFTNKQLGYMIQFFSANK